MATIRKELLKKKKKNTCKFSETFLKCASVSQAVVKKAFNDQLSDWSLENSG